MYNPFSLEDKIVLITGASSGIGRGIAVACSKMGAKVVINGRDQERLNETFNLLENGGHQQIVADLAVQDGIDELVNKCPSINGYVHSAGIPQLCAVKNIKRQEINEILNVNTVSINGSFIDKEEKTSEEFFCCFDFFNVWRLYRKYRRSVIFSYKGCIKRLY